MGFFVGSVFSEALNMDTSIGAILPHDSRFHRGLAEFPPGVAARERPRTLILLHGLTDNWSAWGYRSRILCYAEAHDVAVVIPEVQRSFYQDMVNGEAYFTYVSEELPRLASQLFNISVEPEDLMVAGLSMGGYGALRCGLSRPWAYRAIGAFSSVTDLRSFTVEMPVRKETKNFERVVRGMFGEGLEVPDSAELKSLAAGVPRPERCAPIMMTCGTEDELYPGSAELFEFLKKRGFDVTFDAWKGIHEWGFWDRSVEMFLDRFA